MQLAMIGLGRMGANMTRRLMRAGHQVVAYDVSPDNVAVLAQEGAAPADSIGAAVLQLEAPRVVWVMVPAGAITESVVGELGERLDPGDIVVDGGNTFFKDDIRRARELQARGVRYVDAGTSGGVFGLERGYCLMVGGEREAFERIEPVLRSLAPGRGEIEPTRGRSGAGRGNPTAEEGYLHCGPVGSGHFVKMVHNGIEYGLMQAYAEGFELMRAVRDAEHLPDEQRFELDLGDVAELWRRGSVVGSWLLDLSANALNASPELEEFTGRVPDSGEGRWTVQTAIEAAVPVDVLATALFRRFRSRQERSFADQVLSALRAQFGGHRETPAS